jgi:RNA polymerase sigma-70 factor (ECF subfamily)
MCRARSGVDRRSAALVRAGVGVDGGNVDFEAAFESHHEALFRYVQRLVADTDLASDVVQESFVRLLDHPLPEGEVRRWLFTVATNLVRDDARMKTRRQRLLVERYERSDLASDPAEVPDAAAVRSERIAAARAALAQLSERDRQMLLMREEGFRYSEIADVIGVAPGSVGTLLARALRRFADALDPAHIEEEESV